MSNTDTQALLDKIAALEAQLASTKTREVKGDLIEFTTSQGIKVKGYGVLYYYTKMDGKAYYKEASTVTVLEKRLK